MRLISIDEITGNEVLAQSLYDMDGRKLLNTGVSLSLPLCKSFMKKALPMFT